MSPQNIETDENSTKKRLSKKQIKWIIIIVLILGVVIGFLHQYYLRTDSRIKNVFEDNKTEFQQAAEFFLINDPTESAQKAADEEGYTTPDRKKVPVGLLIPDENNAEIKAQLEQLESSADLDAISSGGTAVTFTTLYGCRYIYTKSGNSPSNDAKKINDNWYYVVSAA